MLKKFLAIAAIFFAGVPALAADRYSADIKIDMDKKEISGSAAISTAGPAVFSTDGFYDIFLDGKPILAKNGVFSVLPEGDKTRTLSFKKRLFPEDILREDFISLSNAAPLPIHNPSMEKTWRVYFPKGFEAISEAESIVSEKTRTGVIFTFSMNKPLERIDIIATDKYVVKKSRVSGTDIYAYFFKEDAGLAEKYLAHTADYIRMYEELFKSDFPYSRFSIVEHESPYGYATPGYTVLGASVLKLPFIIKTSLGHEILHQWFGAAIAAKDERNWFEALTTYLADHLYGKEKGGAGYRKNIMINYDVHAENGGIYPLKDFRYNDSKLSQAVGYGKGALVFHMLKNRLGEDNFYEGIRKFISDYKFKTASWEDIFGSFKKEDLKNYADFWLNSAEIPEVIVSGGEYIVEGGKTFIRFRLLRKNGERTFPIPYKLVYPNREEKGFVQSVRAAEETFKIPVESGALRLVIDPAYDVMRKLSSYERPAVMEDVFSSADLLAVSDGKGSCESFFASIPNIKEVKSPEETSFGDIAGRDVIICGYSNPVTGILTGGKERKDEGLSEYVVFKNPRTPGKTVMIAEAPLPENFRLLTHYGKYSRLAFNGGKNVLKEIASSDNGIIAFEKTEDKGTETSAVKTLDDIVLKAAQYPAVFIGERHDNYAHHLNQLEIIKKLHKSGKKVAVGFEMVQKQFQNVLDDFVQGRIDEKEFLEKSEYYKRWGFDYNLYAPIFRYVRDNGLDAVALNIDGAINRKISSGKAQELTAEEAAQLPEKMEIINENYERDIKEIYDMHSSRRGAEADRAFADFFLAQNVWDETMAESAAKYKKANPDSIFVVIAGSGHMRKDAGIPLRYERLTGEEGYVILQDEALDKKAADIVLFTEPVYSEGTPKLGVSLKEKEGGGIIVEQADKNSPAEKAGLKKEDEIFRCGESPVKSVGDLRYFLFNAGYGAEIKCYVKRNGKTIEKRIILENYEAFPSHGAMNMGAPGN